MKQQKGITLIALIITIIVMLILVAVTLTIVLGDNGILNKARTGTAGQQAEQEREALQAAVLGAYDEVAMEVDFDELVLPEGWSKVETGKYKSPNGNIFTVDGSGTITNDETGSEENEELPEIAWGKKIPEGVIIIMTIYENSNWDNDEIKIYATTVENLKTAIRESYDGSDTESMENFVASVVSGYAGDTLPQRAELGSYIEYEVMDYNNNCYYGINDYNGETEGVCCIFQHGYESVETCGEIYNEILGYQIKSIAMDNEEITDASDVVIPDTITNMEEAFEDCSNLTKVPEIPKSVTNLGHCFYDCDDLTEITYKGTKAQFKTIENYEHLSNNNNITVHCTDGDLTVEACACSYASSYDN